jgi:hypothetical protein
VWGRFDAVLLERTSRALSSVLLAGSSGSACSPNPAFYAATDTTQTAEGSSSSTTTGGSSGACADPSLSLDFVEGIVDPRLQFSRETAASFVDASAELRTSAAQTPRFDHACDPACEARGLLIEGASTNETPTDLELWTPRRSGLTANAGLAPDGTMSAYALADDGASEEHMLALERPVWFDGEVWTYSVFAKPGSLTELRLVNAPQTTYSIAHFDLDDGSVVRTEEGGDVATVVGAGIQPWPGGWSRLWLTFAPPAGSDLHLWLALYKDGTHLYVGSGESLMVWGPQLERGHAPTSYIPNGGEASAARAQDVAFLSDLAWLDPTQGTFALEFSRELPAMGDEWVMRLGDATGGDFIGVRAVTPDVFAAVVQSGGVEQGRIEFPFLPGQRHRVALAWADDRWAASVDGAASQTRSASTLPTNLTRLDLGDATPSGAELHGHIAALRYFACRRDDDELAALSTP